ncbi:hypothetical protein FHX42_002649 [Saccharopolyspora lacisalsi]|uniref:SprT-like family protein n=1 Tax=Halosaccharopolyspora lacisalsi TaxID=1000566 RepID=A0A839E307_9PSEU|nr:hypothetical protein [Halosaccharopolyspora lacisalsi]MBA8825298.1 hypothetical protein [Halosaccharopolyspora lacisalsi]
MSSESTSVTLPLVGALEAVWLAIQRHHAEVPDVVLTLGSGTIGASQGAVTLGHFAARRWQQATGQQLPELFIGGEGLRRSAAEVLGTLLHEAAHALAFARGIKDTSRQGRYHNTRFRTLAEELGITVEHDQSLGWSHTTVPEVTASRYGAEVDRLSQALTAYRYSEYQALIGNPDPGDGEGTTDTPSGTGGRRSNNNGVSAACECGRRIRLARSTYDQGPITCGLCRREFTE